MARLRNAAGFVKANMPLGKGETLTDADAVDVAAYFIRQPRPDFPQSCETGRRRKARRRAVLTPLEPPRSRQNTPGRGLGIARLPGRPVRSRSARRQDLVARRLRLRHDMLTEQSGSSVCRNGRPPQWYRRLPKTTRRPSRR